MSSSERLADRELVSETMPQPQPQPQPRKQHLSSSASPGDEVGAQKAHEGGGEFLRLRGLAKSFAEHAAVKELDLSVREGELVAFLGPSGCGKTTTLRMIAGFIEADAGTISIDGRRVDNLAARHRRTAMVFQDYALFPHMTVFDNVEFGLRMQKVRRGERQRRVQEALEFVQLDNVAAALPKELSGGMQQRVALARAIVVEPRLLLLDEPLSNLDAKLRKKLRVELRELHERLKLTTVFVTHDLEEAFYLADRVAVMHDGRVEQFAPPADLYTKPRSPFVADFVGHTNIIRGECRPDPRGSRSRFVGSGIEVLLDQECADSTTGVYVIPPHRLKLDLSVPTGADNLLEGRVRMVSYLGPYRSVLVDVGELQLQCDVPETAGECAITEGQHVWLHWALEAGEYVCD